MRLWQMDSIKTQQAAPLKQCTWGPQQSWPPVCKHQVRVLKHAVGGAARLRQLDSVKGQRLAALEQRNPGITLAAEWVAANQSRFRGRVYGPVIAEVEVSNPQHAAMLEQHVQSEQLMGFQQVHLQRAVLPGLR